MSDNIEQDIAITRAVNYEKAYVIYKVKITNNLKVPVAKISVRPFISSDLFIMDKTSDSIDLLKPGNSRTVTFRLRPQGECGNVDIQGSVSYYNMSADKEENISIKSIETAVVCPMMKRIKLDSSEWDEVVSSLASVQERTKDVPVGKGELFDIVSDILKDLGMYPVATKTTEMRNVGQFYCEGVKGLKYAVKLEAIGGNQKSKLILRTYAESQESLIGCYYKVLDEIETRTDIKRYIDEPMVVQHFQGDYVSGGKTEIRDSVLQRSQVGGESVEKEKKPMAITCPECGNVIALENKSLLCKGCKKRFCQTCEGWIEKKTEYKGQKIEVRFPLCEDCYGKSYHEQVERIKQKIKEQAEHEELKKRRIESEQLQKQKIREQEEQERHKLEAGRLQKQKEEQEHKYLYGETTPSTAVGTQKAWAQKLKVPIQIQNKIGMKFVLIPPGEFMMGQKGIAEPVHRVKITKPFYMGIYPVTQKEWRLIMSNDPSFFKGIYKVGIIKKEICLLKNNPVEQISWNTVQDFINKLNRLENTNRYKLPTEAEWEYACKAGSTSIYCFGNSKSQLCVYAWYSNCSDNKTHPVGLVEPNLWGLYDMYGNVWEWCYDWYGVYPFHEVSDPQGPSNGSDRIFRGGGWDSFADNCMSVYRNHVYPKFFDHTLGFRLVMSL